MEAMKRYRIGQLVFWYRPKDAPEGAVCVDEPEPKPEPNAKKKAAKAKNKAVTPENKAPEADTK